MDALSQVLSAVRLQSAFLSHMFLRTPWGLHCPRFPGALFYAIIRGRGLMILDDEAPAPLHAGDFVVLPHGDPHAIASASGVAPTSLIDALARSGAQMWTEGNDSTIVNFEYGGKGPVTHMVAGGFYFGAGENPITRELPRVLRLPGGDRSVRPLLDAALRFIADEHEAQHPGAGAAAARLADLIFLQVLRSHWSRPDSGSPGLLRGLGNASIRKALEAMHRAPREAWTIPQLARLAGMSRSNFAARFRDRVGISPKVYLTRWRMQLAAARLADGRIPLATIADELGYRSTFAFAKCFRRVHGHPPGRFRRQHRQPIDSR